LLGVSVSGAGDFDGDGLMDVLVSAPAAGDKGGNTGAAWLIYGSTAPRGEINLANLAPEDGFKIIGEDAGHLLGGQNGGAGTSVSHAGDINGDGYADLVLGSPGPSNTPGAAHIIYGAARGHQWLRIQGSSADEWLVGGEAGDVISGGGGADTIVTYGGDDRIEVNSADFAHIDGGSGFDSLILSGGGIHIDMTTLEPHAIQGIDHVDLTGTGNNELTITEQDVLDMSDTGLLRINGNAGDQVHATGFTDSGSDQTVDGVIYDVWTSGSATIWVEQQTLVS